MKIVSCASIVLAAGLLTGCVGERKSPAHSVESDSQAEVLQSPTPRQLSTEDIARRDEVEAKMMRGEFLHDGPSELIHVGDIDSVPAILVVLKESPLSPNGTMVCTRAHALSALRQITGANLGATDEAWFGWWADYKKSNPGPRRLEK